MKDTLPEVEAKWKSGLMAQEPEERLNLACSQFEFARELVKASILNATPHLSEAMLEKAIFLRFYQNDFNPELLKKVLNRLHWD